MNGSTTAQFLFQAYNQQLTQQAQQYVNTVLPVVSDVMFVVAQIVVLIMGKRAIAGALDVNWAVTYIVRLGFVMLLLVPTNFNKWVTQMATETLPQKIAAAATGNPNTTVSQAFDGELNAIDNLGSKLRAQASGPFYMIERGLIWFYVGCAKFFVLVTEFVWGVVGAVMPFMIPVGAILAPFIIFEATNQWTMRWVGKIFALLLVQFLSLQLGAYVARTDGVYLQQYGTILQATAPQQNFQMNAGDSIFSALGLGALGVGAGQGPGGLTTSQGSDQVTANIATGIATLENVAWTMGYGTFVLCLVTGIAMFLGGGHGFSLAPIANAGSRVTMMVLKR